MPDRFKTKSVREALFVCQIVLKRISERGRVPLPIVLKQLPVREAGVYFPDRFKIKISERGTVCLPDRFKRICERGTVCLPERESVREVGVYLPDRFETGISERGTVCSPDRFKTKISQRGRVPLPIVFKQVPTREGLVVCQSVLKQRSVREVGVYLPERFETDL